MKSLGEMNYSIDALESKHRFTIRERIVNKILNFGCRHKEVHICRYREAKSGQLIYLRRGQEYYQCAHCFKRLGNVLPRE